MLWPRRSTGWMKEHQLLKLGMMETNQRLSFDTVNGVLGKGTGIGFDTFTVYSPTLSSGTNGRGFSSR